MESVFGIVTTENKLIETALIRMGNALGAVEDKQIAMGEDWGLGATCYKPKQNLVSNEDHTLYSAAVGELFGTEEMEKCLLLQGHILEGRNQALLILHAYEETDAEALMALNGLFTAAIIHTDGPRAVLVVDPIGGLTHLHYATFRHGIVFASEIRQILATGLVETEPDEEVVADFFVHGHSLAPRTFFKGVHKVAPGTVVCYQSHQLTVRRIYEFRFDVGDGDEGEHIERFEQALRRAVLLRATGSPPVGAFLSGGLDSSVNVGLLSEVLGAGVRTFSITYPDGRFDESPYSRTVAKHFRTEHHELKLDSPEILDELPTMVWHLEEPTMDSSFVPTYALARFAREFTDKVLSADGPDHLLGRHYPIAVARDVLSRIPGAPIFPWLTNVAPKVWEYLRTSRSGRHVWKTLRSASNSVIDAYLSIYEDIVWGALSPSRVKELLAPDLCVQRSSQPHSDATTFSLNSLTPMEQVILLDMTCNGAFGVFAKMGKMTTAHGLTVREPYFDKHVCEAICSLPTQLKVRGTWSEYLLNRATKKYILRKVAEGLVPDIVLSKPKHGFEAPIGKWLRDWLQDQPVQRILPNLTRTWIQPAFAQRLFDEHLARVRDHSYLLLMLITTELWFQIFLHEGGRRPTYSWREYLHL